MITAYEVLAGGKGAYVVLMALTIARLFWEE